MRRWLLRPFAWSLALVSVLLLIGAWLLDSDWLAFRVKTLAQRRASEYLGREISIEKLDLELLPPGAVASGIVVAGEDGADGQPFATAARVEAVSDLDSLVHGRLRLRSLIVDAPRVRVERREDGSLNVPRPRRGGSGGRRREVSIDQLIVRDGVAWLEDRALPLDLEARGLRARWASGSGDAFELLGDVSSRETRVAVAGLEPYLGEVRGRLRLASGVLEILESTVSGPDLEASSRGRVLWGERSRVELEISAQAAGDLLPRLGLTDVVSGRARFDGALTWSPEGWQLAGGLESPRLIAAGRSLSDLSAQLSVEPGAVAVRAIRGRYRGGSLNAEASVALGGESPRIVVQGRLAGGEVEGILADQGLPIEGLSGTVGGPFEYRCTAAAPREGSGWAELEITATAPTAAGGLPVRGRAPLLIEAGVLSSRAIEVETPSARAHVGGSYDLATRTGSFELSSRVTDPARLFAVLVPERPGAPTMWRPTAGAGTVDGTLRLTPGRFRARLDVDFEDVRAQGYSGDALRGWLALSGAGIEGMRLELSRPNAALVVQGRVPFAEGGVGSALSLQVEAAAWPWEDVSAWLPWTFPVTGAVSGSISLAGPPEALEGFVRARVEEAAVAGVQVDRILVDLGLLDGEVEVNEIRVATPAGGAVLSGSLGQRLDLELRAEGLALAEPPFDEALPGPLEGSMDLVADIGGSPERPTVTASLTGSRLALGGRTVGGDGSARLELDWREGRARLQGTLLGLVELSGAGTLDPEHFDLRIDLATESVAMLAELATGTAYPELAGSVGGRLTASGSWSGEDLEASLTGDALALSWGGRQLHLLEPYRITLAQRELKVESLYLGDQASQSELVLYGEVPLVAGEALDLRIQVALSSAWAEPLLPTWTIGPGRFEGLGSVRGTIDAPRVSGQGELTQSSLLIPGAPGSIQQIEGYVLFDPGRIVLDSFHGEFAGGTLRAEGALALPGAPTTGLQYQMQVSADGVTVRYPEGFLLRGGAEASVTSTPEGRRISGIVDLDRAFYLEDVPIGFSQLLQNVFARQPMELRETDELLASTELNLLIRGPDALSVRNNVADLDGDIDLAVRGSLARPVVFGTVEVEEGGKLIYSGNEYEVQRGVLTFANPFRIEPVIDLVATTELREYDVTLTLAGTLDQLNATVVSDPPLADLDVLALLTSGGELPSRAERIDSRGEEATAAGLLYGQAASVVAKRFNRLFGLDKFRIDPLTQSSGNLESARVTVGERLSSDLFATYSYDPSRTDVQILELEWQVNRAVTIIATQNGDGTYALDVRWQKSF